MKRKEPEIFEYFNIILDDTELQQFDKNIKKRKKVTKQVRFSFKIV
jgi:hypothetical protein